MDVTNSRRILLLGTREAGALDVVKDLTGSAPAPDVNGSTAGLIHEWDAQTRYYTAKVPIWIDEVSDIATWKSEFLREEAKEVVDAVGAWIYCFEQREDDAIGDEAESAMKAIQEVVERHGMFGSEVVFLAVAKGAGLRVSDGRREEKQEEREDKCIEYGFEYIQYGATGDNEFGEKVGFERLKEALEANEWAAVADEDDEIQLAGLDLGLDDEDGGFGMEEAEMTAELFGMKAALNREEDDEFDDDLTLDQQAGQVDGLNRLMGKLMAVKEQSADLPEAQRKRIAAQAVRDIMKENPSV